MNTIFRVRPCNDTTIDELVNSYLWFSRPTEFKGDAKDANIGAFVTDTEAIKRGLEACFHDFPYEKLYKEMSYTGICCFTKELPSSTQINHFPNCTNKNCISIEFDKVKIEDFFKTHRCYPIYPCFNEVVYSKEPTKLETCDQWSILWETIDNVCIYKTIPGIVHEHPRNFDEFIRKLLTRIDSKFQDQKEERIILGGCNIPQHAEETKGYKIGIPSDAILKIHVYPGVKKEFIAKLKGIDSIRDKITLVDG